MSIALLLLLFINCVISARCAPAPPHNSFKPHGTLHTRGMHYIRAVGIVYRTSCCSTDSEMPHRSCRIRLRISTARQTDISYIYNGLGDAPKQSLSLGTYMVPWTHLSQYPSPKRHLDQFMRFSTAQGCDKQTDTQPRRPRNIGNIGRILLPRSPIGKSGVL